MLLEDQAWLQPALGMREERGGELYVHAYVYYSKVTCTQWRSANILTRIHVYMHSHNQVLSAVAESTFHVHAHCAVDVHVST